MAKVLRTVCDVCGADAQHHVEFTYDGTRRLDLCSKDLAGYRAALRPFATKAARAAGRRGSGRGRVTSSSRSRSGRQPTDSQAIRAWAVQNGVAVPQRGRIPATVRAQYEQRAQ